MNLLGTKWTMLLALISVFTVYGCNAQVKLEDPKSIANAVKGSINVTDIGHYGEFFEESTGINFENYRKFTDGRVLPTDYADTFDIDRFSAGLIDAYIIEIGISNYQKDGQYLIVKFQTNESTFNSVKLNIKNDLLSTKDFNLLLSGEYAAYLSKPDGTIDHFYTSNYINGDFDEESTKNYNYYVKFKPILEKNFAIIKEYVSNKGWEKQWYVRDLPGGAMMLFKGVQTESFLK
jgi:hypothetical protein